MSKGGERPLIAPRRCPDSVPTRPHARGRRKWARALVPGLHSAECNIGGPHAQACPSRETRYALTKVPVSIIFRKWASIWVGRVPPVMRTPSSMLMENAYSVRLAEDRKSQRPSAAAHL